MENRKEVIEALRNKDLEKLKELNSKKVYIGTFLDALKFTSWDVEGDGYEPVFLDTPFTRFLEELSEKVNNMAEVVGIFNQGVFDKISNEWQSRIIKTIISRLSYVGDQFIISSRNNDTYKDQTGNLRASIGYVIFFKGENVSTVFPGTDKKGLEHEQGKQAGIELAQNIANDYPEDIVMICVAGMNYAAVVESRGLDVITNASIEVRTSLIKAVENLNKKISNGKF